MLEQEKKDLATEVIEEREKTSGLEIALNDKVSLLDQVMNQKERDVRFVLTFLIQGVSGSGEMRGIGSRDIQPQERNLIY